MASTHDMLAGPIHDVLAARTQWANAELELTGNVEEDFEAWEGAYVAASNLESAAEALAEAVRGKLRTAEEDVEAARDMADKFGSRTET